MTAPGEQALVPGPPPGPGVQPPFIAPPTDGTKQRRWIAAGLAGAAALLLCVSGLVGLGGLVIFGNQMALDQSKAAVTDYLTALQAGDFDRAYSLLCEAQQRRIGPVEYARGQELQPAVVSFTVGEPVLDTTIEVPATVDFADYSRRTVRYRTEPDQRTAEYEVCGQTD